jgi:phage terminase small subunit
MKGHRPSKSAVLHRLHGTARRDRQPGGAPEASGRPRPPRYLQGRALELWYEVLPGLHWLRSADSHCLAAWCSLQTEFEKNPGSTIASRFAQLRLLGAELGMTPRSRRHLAVSPPSSPLNDDEGDGESLVDYLRRHPGSVTD